MNTATLKVQREIEYPKIERVPEGVHRPLWSVMIPNYNCAHYLAQTLESVMIELPGKDISKYYYENPFRPPVVVVRRRFYEQFGGIANF